MSVAMALFELLQLFLIFLDHPRIEYLWHVPIMPPINQKGMTFSTRSSDFGTEIKSDRAREDILLQSWMVLVLGEPFSSASPVLRISPTRALIAEILATGHPETSKLETTHHRPPEPGAIHLGP